MKVLIIGSNPSQKSPDETPFHKSTQSRTILDKWFDGWDVEFTFTNVSSTPTDNNRPLRVSEIRDNLPALRETIDSHRDHKIVTLGKTAERALNMLELDFFAAPHPSGCNRQLNDQEFVADMLCKLRKYLSGE